MKIPLIITLPDIQTILTKMETQSGHKEFWIPGNVPSSKNSRQFNIKQKRSFESKVVQRYKRATQALWAAYGPRFSKQIKQYPVFVGFYVIRDSKRRWDFHNAVQVLADLMVANEWIEDDNVEHFIPVYMGHEYDKKNAGVIIKIIEK